jgi:hypothetical protein
LANRRDSVLQTVGEAVLLLARTQGALQGFGGSVARRNVAAHPLRLEGTTCLLVQDTRGSCA